MRFDARNSMFKIKAFLQKKEIHIVQKSIHSSKRLESKTRRYNILTEYDFKMYLVFKNFH